MGAYAFPLPAAVAQVFPYVDEKPDADGDDAQKRLHRSSCRIGYGHLGTPLASRRHETRGAGGS